MNKTRTLEVLDFAPGIRAFPINYNFNLLKSWIEHERLRVSGWGIVEGFELKENLDNFTISVSDGVMINKNGEQLEIEREVFDGYELDPEYGLRPRVMKFVEKNLEVEDDSVTLQYPIYTEDSNSVVYTSGKLPSDIIIKNSATGDILTANQIRSISANNITFVSGLGDLNVDVEYKITVDLEGKYAGDRMDGIFIRKDATPYSNGSMFRYHIGYSTDTPTCYEDEYVIGYAYWHVGKVIEVEFITSDRSYRQVYVDENGQLWLMGKLYEGYKFILFKEEEKDYDDETGKIKKSYNRPADVTMNVENDLWYDVDENILKIWRKGTDGEYNWYPVNDLSRFKRECRIFKVDELPKDLQTFDFDLMGETQLRFTPGAHQLTVIIDQVVVMEDQLIELTDDDTETNVSGHGFKLVDPLDEPTIVEVRVDHNAYRTDDCYKDVFEKTACFVYDNNITVASATSGSTYYTTDIEYEYGQKQLEVWVNGLKLVRGLDFFEYKNVENAYIPADSDSKPNAFMLKKPVKAGDNVSYKISRYMSTYANFKSVISDIENTQAKMWSDFKNSYDEHLDNFETFCATTNSSLKSNKDAVEKISSDYRKASSKLGISDLNISLQSAVNHKATFYKNLKTTQPISLAGSTNDFYYVIWTLDDERAALIRDYDYFIEQSPDDDSLIELSLADTWQSSKARLYIEKRTFSEAE